MAGEDYVVEAAAETIVKAEVGQGRVGGQRRAVVVEEQRHGGRDLLVAADLSEELGGRGRGGRENGRTTTQGEMRD